MDLTFDDRKAVPYVLLLNSFTFAVCTSLGQAFNVITKTSTFVCPRLVQGENFSYITNIVFIIIPGDNG